MRRKAARADRVKKVLGWVLVTAPDLCRGIAKLVKALDFDSSMRRFESFFPCQRF
jgi:hypothetical protein